MSRNLADLKLECSGLGLTVRQSGKREAKSDYEEVLRSYYWNRDHAGQAMPEQIEPMLARNLKDLELVEAEAMWKSAAWAAQEKINGCRCVLKVTAPWQTNVLTSRRTSDETYRKNDLSDVMPHYRDMDLGLEWTDTIVDGEVLMGVARVDTGSVVTEDILQATAAVLNCDPVKSVAIQAKFGKLILHAFDILRYKGRDVRRLPYSERYKLLADVVARVAGVVGDIPCEHCNH